MENLTVSSRSVLGTVSFTAIVGSCTWFLRRLWQQRMLFRKLQERGLPMLPHSFALGHLLHLHRAFKAGPVDMNKMLPFTDIMFKNFLQQGAYYIDLWPFSEPFLVVLSPTLAAQATQANAKVSMQRPPALKEWLGPFAGGPNLFDLPEKEWKPLRQLINQGFAATQTLSLIPAMVEESLVLCKRLRTYAERSVVFHLEHVAWRYIMDVMGRTIQNARLGAQTGYNPLVDSMESQIAWHPVNRETSLSEHLNFLRPIVQSWNGRTMDRFIEKELDQRFTEYQQDTVKTRSKSVIDLILQAYMSDSSRSKHKMDADFRAFAVRQIRLFAFVGTGSTSATITYAIHLLCTNPTTLNQIRAEHDSIFGSDIPDAARRLSEQPRLLNQLPYTRAVAKETSRLFPAASGIRQGHAGEDLIDADGTRYPTDGVLIWLLHPASNRAPTLWPRPHEFLPERWLVEPGHELYPRKGAWRTFEHGPRNCVGMDLAMAEVEVALVMLARAFAFAPAYGEWDAARAPRKGPTTFWGERAYQVESGAAVPAERYPCRVAVRGGSAGGRERLMDDSAATSF